MIIFYQNTIGFLIILNTFKFMKEEIIESFITKTPLCYKMDHGNGFIAYLDYSSGYFSNNLMIDKSEYQKEFEETSPEIVRELKIVDTSNKQCWYPMVTKKDEFIILPEGNKDLWMWCVVPLKGDNKDTLKPVWEDKKNFPHNNYLSVVNYADDLLPKEK